MDACFVELNLHEGNYDDLTDHLKNLLSTFEDYTASTFISDYNLPYYLRAFTAGEKFVHSFSYAIDLLIKKKDYSQAAAFLRVLIAQHIYGMNEIADWYSKLIWIMVRYLFLLSN